MRVCITGGSGFIGTNLTLWFAENEPDTEVVIFDIVPPQIQLKPNHRYVYGDIRNLVSLLIALDGCDEVYNLAGILGTSELIPVSSLASEINITGAANVLDASRLLGVSRVYNVAKPHFNSFSENTYTLTKHSAEMLGIMYKDTYDMSIATVRWLNAVGAYQHLYPVRKFIPTMVLFALYGLPLEVYGTGEQTIDPIDVRDLSFYTVYACRNLGKSGKVVDLGSGVAISCNDCVDIIMKVFKEKGYISKSTRVNIPMRSGEGEGVNIVADTAFWDSKGMTTKVSFEESIASVLDYIVSLPEYYRQNALSFYSKVQEHSVCRA